MNATAVNPNATTSYVCLFCGVSYEHVVEMHNCSICGHTVAGGWLIKQTHDYSEHDYPEQGWKQIYPAA